MKTRQTQTVFTGSAVLIFWLLLSVSAPAQQPTPAESRTGRLTLGADIGLQGATADAAAFAIGLSGDYFLTDNVSVGPLVQIGVTDDLFQIGPTVQAKYTFDLATIPELKPNLQGGIGFIYANLDRSHRTDSHDASFLIPLGFGAEYRLSRDLSLASSFLFNFTDLNDVRNENFFITWLVGIRVHF